VALASQKASSVNLNKIVHGTNAAAMRMGSSLDDSGKFSHHAPGAAAHNVDFDSIIRPGWFRIHVRL
jgi:hypothetical protein